jgi:hypothetical protein
VLSPSESHQQNKIRVHARRWRLNPSLARYQIDAGTQRTPIQIIILKKTEITKVVMFSTTPGIHLSGKLGFKEMRCFCCQRRKLERCSNPSFLQPVSIMHINN